jgi:uncharacterized protein (DUF488 family)
MPAIWTIGHSTRPLPEFLALLTAQDIRLLIDVRRYPGSKRHPQFNTDALAAALGEHGMAYRHASELGGRRTPRADSVNHAWRNASFRGYADYMATDEFAHGLDEAVRTASHTRTVLMCAEAVPWRCHRLLLSDAFIARGWTVCHIVSTGRLEEHRLTDFARIGPSGVTYPAGVTSQHPLF